MTIEVETVHPLCSCPPRVLLHPHEHRHQEPPPPPPKPPPEDPPEKPDPPDEAAVAEMAPDVVSENERIESPKFPKFHPTGPDYQPRAPS